ncbi:hypothetical protein PFISCL1PPCAC_17370 [Pristionchus fissidentatus]|uniref:Arrestin C-terminal-like domain-containing protein n=1 Tax=Pristionchus fissidentatus TaxID=1538716 RepID=A0AAV5W3D0_9BILA|nr:hypothetical protein PFISCL1PPCAC_17370 [Pristionchus fissidentatus]
MRIDKFDLILDRGSTNQPYFAGQSVQGQIEVHAARRVRVGSLHVRLSGTVETGWRNKSSDLITIVDHCNDSFRLHEGQHCIPFEIKLPLSVLSSIEREQHGSIRYMCTAVLDLPDAGGTQLVAEKEFRVFSLLNLDAPHLRDSAASTEEEDVSTCCGLRNRYLAATMRISETGLLPGETTRISLSIETRKKRKRFRRLRRKEKHECVLISLCQQIDFVSTARLDPLMVDRKTFTVAVESHGTCKGAECSSGPETKEVEFCVPEGLPPTSVQADGLITVSYFFKLDLERFDVIVPVVIGSLKTPGSFA